MAEINPAAEPSMRWPPSGPRGRARLVHRLGRDALLAGHARLEEAAPAAHHHHELVRDDCGN